MLQGYVGVLLDINWSWGRENHQQNPIILVFLTWDGIQIPRFFPMLVPLILWKKTCLALSIYPVILRILGFWTAHHLVGKYIIPGDHWLPEYHRVAIHLWSYLFRPKTSNLRPAMRNGVPTSQQLVPSKFNSEFAPENGWQRKTSRLPFGKA